MILEALRQAVDLLQQPARHVAQRLRLIGEDADGFLGLRPNLIGRLLDQVRVIGKQLIELRALLAELAFDGLGMLA